jgi:hypothetical protein
MSNITSSPPKGKKILEQVSDAIRLKHYCYGTEQTYKEWIKRYILFHQKRHPDGMGDEEIRAFLIHLAEKEQVAASTHTAPVVGAGGIRHSVRSYFFIGMS